MWKDVFDWSEGQHDEAEYGVGGAEAVSSASSARRSVAGSVRSGTYGTRV